MSYVSHHEVLSSSVTSSELILCDHQDFWILPRAAAMRKYPIHEVLSNISLSVLGE